MTLFYNVNSYRKDINLRGQCGIEASIRILHSLQMVGSIRLKIASDFKLQGTTLSLWRGSARL